MNTYLRPLLLILLIMAISWFYLGGEAEFLSFENIRSNLQYIQGLYAHYPLRTPLIFSGIIVLMTGLSIPGSIVLTLLAGSIFGVLPGTILVCLATTSGGSIAFLISRFLFKDFVTRRFEKQAGKMNKKISEEGPIYLLTLRLVPASPFVIVNLLMGLTSMRLLPFALVTLGGTFPGTFIYVYAGRRFSEISSLSGIMSFPLILSLLALSLLPSIWETMIKKKRTAKEHDMNKPEHRSRFYTVSGVEFEGEDLVQFGKGRSNEAIKADASEALADHPEIDASEIELLVEDGAVCLTGTVENIHIKRLAGECVETITGVGQVINQLMISSRKPAKDLQSELSNDLLRDEELRKQKMG